MLQAVVLELKAVKDAALPPSHGAMAYAAALDLILRQDVELARDLHDLQGVKPLKCSLLKGELPVGQDNRYLWRLCALEERTAACLTRLTVGSGIRIGDAVFSLEKMYGHSEEHPEAGQTDYAILLEQQLPAETVTLEFVTPATFRAGRVEQPFPIPALVFQSLYKQWEAWSRVPMPVDVDTFKEQVVLGNWRGETRRVETGGRRTVGFTGQFTYRLLDKQSKLCRTLAALSTFAFYSGIGWQTAHGLGQVRLKRTSFHKER